MRVFVLSRGVMRNNPTSSKDMGFGVYGMIGLVIPTNYCDAK